MSESPTTPRNQELREGLQSEGGGAFTLWINRQTGLLDRIEAQDHQRAERLAWISTAQS
jgi:hypothetical protein